MRCKLFVGQNGNRLLWLLSGIIMIVFWLSKLIEVGFIVFNTLKYSISLKNNDNNVKLTPLLTDLYLSHVNTNWSINTVWLFMANIFSNTHLAVCFSYAFKELRDLKFRYWDQKFCNNFNINLFEDLKHNLLTHQLRWTSSICSICIDFFLPGQGVIAVCNEERNTVAGTCLFGSSCKLKACFCFCKLFKMSLFVLS